MALSYPQFWLLTLEIIGIIKLVLPRTRLSRFVEPQSTSYGQQLLKDRGSRLILRPASRIVHNVNLSFLGGTLIVNKSIILLFGLLQHKLFSVLPKDDK